VITARRSLVDLRSRPSARDRRRDLPMISTVWMNSGVPRNSTGGDVGPDCPRGRAVPGSGPTASPARAGSRAWRPASRRPRTLRGWPGWRNYRVLWWRCEASPTGRHARSGRDVPAAFRATGCGPVSTRCHTPIAQDHRKRYRSRTHAVHVPHPLIKEAVPRPSPPGPCVDLQEPVRRSQHAEERDHRQSRGTRQSRFRSEWACPPAGDGRQGDHGIR